MIQRHPSAYPRFRFMGSKQSLVPFLDGVFDELEFDTALDAFSGSGCVGYSLAQRGARVTCNDFLRFTTEIATALVANRERRLGQSRAAQLIEPRSDRRRFIEETFAGIFYEVDDLRMLDSFWKNLDELDDRILRAIALTAMFRACLKKQPRGVFTFAGSDRYDDGRRDLSLTLTQHFLEQVDVVDAAVLDDGPRGRAVHGDVFDLDVEAEGPFDLVYLDPPYVPRADDNCYIKRYHFLEGLASHWRAPEIEIMESSVVKKLAKRRTPFSYRKTAIDAFTRLFDKFRESTIVMSYSSNGWPDVEELITLMKRAKADVQVHESDHRYHFGTHARVDPRRAKTVEYLLVGRGTP